MSFQRGIHVNTSAIVAAAQNRDLQVASEHVEPLPAVKAAFAPKFRTAKASGQRSLASIDNNQKVAVGQKTGLFASDVEAMIASKRLESKIREAAMRRSGAL